MMQFTKFISARNYIFDKPKTPKVFVFSGGVNLQKSAKKSAVYGKKIRIFCIKPLILF